MEISKSGQSDIGYINLSVAMLSEEGKKAQYCVEESVILSKGIISTPASHRVDGWKEYIGLTTITKATLPQSVLGHKDRQSCIRTDLPCLIISRLDPVPSNVRFAEDLVK